MEATADEWIKKEEEKNDANGQKKEEIRSHSNNSLIVEKQQSTRAKVLIKLREKKILLTVNQSTPIRLIIGKKIQLGKLYFCSKNHPSLCHSFSLLLCLEHVVCNGDQ